MTSIYEAGIRLRAPLARSWRLISDIEQYRAWHPFADFVGIVAPCAPVILNIRSQATKKTVTSARAIITRAEQFRALAWRVKYRGLISFEEAFEISKDGEATYLLHKIRVTGPFSTIVCAIFGSALRRLLNASNRALADHISNPIVAARYSPQPFR